MSRTTDHIEYLAKEIGPRPAGTEEERQAALYITEQFQKEAGFTASIEDFSSSSNVEGGLAVLAGVAVAATVLAMVFPVLAIPAFILTAAAAAVYSLEHFDRPVISRVLSRGASQNVVAKYQPGHAEGTGQPIDRRASAHSRKLILVAHYDTGRVVPPLVERVESLGLPLPLVCVVSMIAAAFFLLIRIFISSGGGMGLLVLNVLSTIVVVVCLLPIVKAVLVRSAPYNEGAANNASGTAALIAVARRIARGSVSEADLAGADDVNIHGEAAAREAGLVPEGVQIRYEAETLVPPSEFGERNEEERLLSAKAAIAALTGQPVERRAFGSVAGNLVNSRAESEFSDAPVEVSAASGSVGEASFVAAQPVPVGESGYQAFEPVGDAEGFENAPGWFVAAQQNAKRSERFNVDDAPQVKRSKYTEAMEYAERGRADREEEARAAEQAAREAEQRAREDEARAAAAQAEITQAEMESRTEAELAVGPNSGSEPALAVEPVDAPMETIVPAPEPAPVATGPDGTVAMPAPISSSEILAEAAAEQTAKPIPESTTQARMAALPAIEPTVDVAPTTPEPTASPSRSGILRSLRANVPSLSGLIDPVRPSVKQQDGKTATDRRAAVKSVPDVAPQSNRQQPSAATPASVPAAATVSQRQPQPEPELVSLDAAHEGGSSSAARKEVDIPRSRSGNLLNRLRKNAGDDLADTPQQWLDVDEDFEARDVGRERGSWESFRDDQYFDDDDGFGDFSSGDSGRGARSWQGGAASSRVQLGHVDTRSGVEFEPEVAVEPVVSEPASIDEYDSAINEEIEQIYHFRNPLFSTEIWFVAMGADGESHDGARAFIDEHRDELHGSMVIEIESLGVGDLAVAKEEGRVRKVQASSRVKRYTRNATAATGIAPDSVSLIGTDSISSTLQRAGFQTMHLFGAENGRPALKGSADDVVENVDEELLDEHLNFVFELLKSR